MGNFRLIKSGIDVTAAVAQLDGQPDLWDTRVDRLSYLGPHRETSDIWVRFRDPRHLTSAESYREPHLSVWYPAWHALPALRPIVFDLASCVEATHIGGVLITKIPAGGRVYEHDDRGGWHSEYHDAKVWIPLRANDGCLNHCEGDTVIMEAGTAWTFSNLKRHSVENRGATERVCLIVCFRSCDADESQNRA